MIIHDTPSLRIFFGDKKNSITKDTYSKDAQPHQLIHQQPFDVVQKKLQCQELYFLQQVHGIDGECITHESGSNFISFSYKGDFLITDGHGIGLGIITADCLPIVLYDAIHHVVSIVHSGWRGAVNGVVQNTIKMMQNKYGTSSASLQCFFGPSIKSCCYEVGDEVVQQVKKYLFGTQALECKNGKIYFNLSLFTKLLLVEQGVLRKNISLVYNQCTCCNEQFCSYRRDSGDKQRNLTIVALK